MTCVPATQTLQRQHPIRQSPCILTTFQIVIQRNTDFGFWPARYLAVVVVDMIVRPLHELILAVAARTLFSNKLVTRLALILRQVVPFLEFGFDHVPFKCSS